MRSPGKKVQVTAKFQKEGGDKARDLGFQLGVPYMRLRRWLKRASGGQYVMPQRNTSTYVAPNAKWVEIYASDRNKDTRIAGIVLEEGLEVSLVRIKQGPDELIGLERFLSNTDLTPFKERRKIRGMASMDQGPEGEAGSASVA